MSFVKGAKLTILLGKNSMLELPRLKHYYKGLNERKIWINLHLK
jgi:hypothetical protein